MTPRSSCQRLNILLKMLHFRPYSKSDEEDCLRVFYSNVPEFFAEKEAAAFIASLSDPEDLFEVVLLDERVIGVGGIWVNEERKEARLCYGIIERMHHKRGVGKKLLDRRLERIRSYGFIEKITHETGQGTYRFFEKYGFRTVRIDDDPENIGIDFYQMEMIV